MARVKYRDFEQAVQAVRQVSLYTASLAGRSSLMVVEAKTIPSDLRAMIGRPAMVGKTADKFGFQPVRAWVKAESVAAVNAYFAAEMGGGPVNAVKSLSDTVVAARALANYVHDNISALAEKTTDKATDTMAEQAVPAAMLAEIKTLAGVIPPLLTAFVE